MNPLPGNYYRGPKVMQISGPDINACFSSEESLGLSFGKKGV